MKTWEKRLELECKKMEEHLRCSCSSVAFVFLWYLFKDIYCKDQHDDSGLPPGTLVLVCLEHRHGLTDENGM